MTDVLAEKSVMMFHAVTDGSKTTFHRGLCCPHKADEASVDWLTS